MRRLTPFYSSSAPAGDGVVAFNNARSEEHTSELQSLTNLVCRLLLETQKSPTHLSACPPVQQRIGPSHARRSATSTPLPNRTPPKTRKSGCAATRSNTKTTDSILCRS